MQDTRRPMTWIIFALGGVLAWGMYGPALHRGQMELGSPWRALLCVGLAYFLIGVLVPLASLSAGQGGIGGFNLAGSIWATVSGAPLVNVLVSMLTHPPKTSPNPLLYVGYVVTALGAGMVLYYKPA